MMSNVEVKHGQRVKKRGVWKMFLDSQMPGLHFCSLHCEGCFTGCSQVVHSYVSDQI